MVLNPCTAEGLVELFDLLPDAQRQQFHDLFLRRFDPQALTAETMMRLLTALPRGEFAAFWRELERLKDDLAAQAARAVRGEASKIRAAYDSRRNRKPAAATVKRNVTICDLHHGGWSFGQLAKKYQITKQVIGRIVKDEAKWRCLAGLSPN
jgi:hypothetical protein